MSGAASERSKVHASQAGLVEDEAEVFREASAIESQQGLLSGLDAQALAESYRRNSATVVRYCRHLLGDGSEAQDVVQDVFIRVMRYGTSMRSRSLPLSWLYRAAARCCYDRLRLRARVVSLPDDALEALPARASAARVDLGEQLERLLRTLKPDLAQLFVLHYIEGLQQEKVACRLGYSRRTIGKKMKRLRRVLHRVSAAV